MPGKRSVDHYCFHLALTPLHRLSDEEPGPEAWTWQVFQHWGEELVPGQRGGLTVPARLEEQPRSSCPLAGFAGVELTSTVPEPEPGKA